MGSNTHENLVIALDEIEEAIAEEREGTGASNGIIQRIVKARHHLYLAQEVQQAILGDREPRTVLRPQRTPEEIKASGAAWITEDELAWLIDELYRHRSGSEIPMLRQMLTAQAEEIDRLRGANND